MHRLALPVVLVATTFADGQDPAGLKAFHGVWVTDRPQKEGGPVQLALEFKGGDLTLSTRRDGKAEFTATLKVTGAEAGRYQDGRFEPARLVLTHGSTKYSLYYEFVGDRLVLLGNLPNRPFEGLSLSGDYRRGEKSK